MAQAGTIVVYDASQLAQAIDSYVMQGYQVASREPWSATMVKRKEFNVVWAVIGFFLCLLPLLVYLVVYACQQDQVVFIRVQQDAGPAAVAGGTQWSPDGRYWWDGTAWQPARPPG